MDGDHSLDDCDDVTGRTLQALYDALYEHRVDLEGSLLKPNMVIPGKGNADQASPERIAKRRSRASAVMCRPRCRESCSSPAASPKSRPPST